MSRLLALAVRGSERPEKYTSNAMQLGASSAQPLEMPAKQPLGPVGPGQTSALKPHNAGVVGGAGYTNNFEYKGPSVAPTSVGGNPLVKFDPNKHPRGGIPQNKGEFSSTSGPMGAKAGTTAGESRATDVTGGNQPAADHAARHAFTKSQLGNVAEPLKGLMAAFHAHPDVASGGASATQAVAPNLGRQAYAWLRQNAAQPKHGLAAAGQAVDLGQGKLGYASPAGSIIVWPADSSGKHQIKFTNQTGVVARAMGSPAQQNSAGQPGQRPAAPQTGGIGATLANPVPPPVIAPPQFSASANRPTTPTGQHADLRTGAPPPQTSSPFAPPVIAQAPPQPGFEPSKATPEQLASTSALTEKPQPKTRPGGPQTPREIAEGTKQELARATAQWQSELAGGLSPKGNARWRSYLAALNSIHGHQDKLAREHERQEKASQKPPKSGDAAKPALSDHEAAASKNAPDAFRDLQAMREGIGEVAYQDGVKQLARQTKKPWEGRMLGGFQESQVEQPPEKSQRPQVPPGALPPDERGAMSRLGIDPATGKPTKPQIPAGAVPPGRNSPPEGPQWRHARDAFKKPVQPPAPPFIADWPGTKPKPAPPTAFETPPVEQPKPAPGIEGSNKYKALVKQKADEWDMKPEDFHALADDLHKELTEHYGQREAAKQYARKALNLHAGDINRLENQGLDSGSKHAKIKQLDTVGRELAAQYPQLGWGRGREDDSDTGVDYGEKLWELIKEGAKGVPSRTSSEFMDHVEEYLHSQLKRHGSSGTQGGHAAESEDLSAVPFTERRDGLVERYRQYLNMAAQ
jgi:hypothetical protein